MARFFALCFVGLLFLLSSPGNVYAYYTNMPASVVVGQSDFTGSSSGITQTTFSTPDDLVVVNNKLIVADQANHRVLIWNSVPTSNGVPADVVLGQPNFTSNTAANGGITAKSLERPSGVASNGTNLIVADRNQHRVLIWNTIPTTNFASADVVIGQTGFTSASANQGGSVGANTLKLPDGVYWDGQRLIIADSNNNRVLLFNSIPTSNNSSANVVLGQTGFTSGTANNGGISAATMSYPHGVFSDRNKLVVAEELNHRVLIWNSIPSTNGTAADVVVGQPDFASNSDNQGGTVKGNTLSFPAGIASIHSNRLFVTDVGNSRMLIYNSVPTINNQSADLVIGQPNFTSNTANNGGIGSHTLNLSIGTVYDDKLFVLDAGNHRILIFNNIHSGPHLSMNTPMSISDGKLKVSGSVQLGERGKYALQRMQANVNGQGYSNVSWLSGGRDLSSDQTGYDFSHEFEPWAGISSRDTYTPSTGYTLQLKASSFNAEEDNLFYFQPFQLSSISGNTLKIKLNKDHWDRIKNNLDSYEIQQKKGTTWTTLVEKVPLDPESITSTKSLGGEVRIVAKDKWGHRQTVTNSINTGSSLSSYNLNTQQVTAGFPLQINNISGFNTGIISTYMSLSDTSFTSSTSRPVFSGIAYVNSTVTILVTDPVIGRSQIFTTVTKFDSSWSITPTLYSASVIDTWVSDSSNRYTELPGFKLSLVRSEQ